MAINKALESIPKLIGLARKKCSNHHHYNISSYVLKADVDKLTQKLTDLCEGLCSRCVREGKDLQRKCADEQHRD